MKIYKLLLAMLMVLFVLCACKQTPDEIPDEIPDETPDGTHEQDEPEKDEPGIHIHIGDDQVIENVIPVSCTEDGSYELVTYCRICGDELQRKTKVDKSEGHQESDPVTENEVSPDCYNDGSYDTVVYCSVCNLELGRECFVVESQGHVPGEEFISDVTEPLCREDGSCYKVVECQNCQEILFSDRAILPATGHIWNDSRRCSACDVKYSVEECLDFRLSDDGTYYIITGIGTFMDTELHMPSSYKGLPVREIANYAFQDCTFVTKAYIPETIVRIGYGAAMGCTALEKLVFEDIRGWNLMEGYDDTEGLSIPAFMMVSTGIYIERLVSGDFFWLTKDQ